MVYVIHLVLSISSVLDEEVGFDVARDLEESDTENVAEITAKDKKIETKKRGSVDKEVKNVTSMKVSGKTFLFFVFSYNFFHSFLTFKCAAIFPFKWFQEVFLEYKGTRVCFEFQRRDLGEWGGG